MTVGVAALHSDDEAATTQPLTGNSSDRNEIAFDVDILNTPKRWRRRRRRRAELLFTFVDAGPGESPGNIGERDERAPDVTART